MKKNVAGSVHARLRNRAQETREDVRFLLQRYAAERLLYRLGKSDYREQFVLKGAMLFPLWGGSVYRPTRDLDFMKYGGNDADSVLASVREICLVAVPDDGLVFDASTLTAEPTREEAEYSGVRVRIRARLGEARIDMQIDVGFGNVILPGPADVEYPTLLDAARPTIRAYPQEAVVAEKLHAMVILGERNTRLKDFYDLHSFASQFSFDGERLAHAVAATFDRRRSAIEVAVPAALAPRFYADGARAAQWRAYLSRNTLPGAARDFALVGETIRAFLGPVWSALAAREDFTATWRPGGPWKAVS